MKIPLLLSLVLLGGCRVQESAIKQTASPVIEARSVATPQPAFNLEPLRSETTSPDGTLAATGTLRTDAAWTGLVTIRDTKSGRLVAKWRVSGGAAGLAFSRDNKWLAVGGRNTLTVWEWRAKRIVHVQKIRDEDEYFPDIHSDFSPDGRVLAISYGAVELMNARTWKMIHAFEGEGDPDIVQDVTFSPDNRFVISTNYDRDIAYSLIDTRTLQVRPLAQGEGWDKPIFSRDGRLIALHPMKDDVISIWNTRRARPISALKLADFDSVPISFSPDARLLAVKNDKKGYEVWRVRDAKRIFAAPQTADSLAWLDSHTFRLRSGNTTKRVVIAGGAK